MLDHLLPSASMKRETAEDVFVPARDITPMSVMNAKIKTEEWLRDMGVDDEVQMDPALEESLAVQAFSALTGLTQGPPEEIKAEQAAAVMGLTTTGAVKAAADMVSAYQWQFVEKAAEIRAYIVTSLIEETKGKNVHARLKALKMLGDVTEIGLFTQKVQHEHVINEEEVEERLKARLKALIVDIDAVDTTLAEAPTLRSTELIEDATYTSGKASTLDTEDGIETDDGT